MLIFIATIFIILGTFVIVTIPNQHKFLRQSLEQPEWNSPNLVPNTTTQTPPTTVSQPTKNKRKTSWHIQKIII